MIRTAFTLVLVGALSLLSPLPGGLGASAEALSRAEAVRVSDATAWQDGDVEPRMAAEAFILAMAAREANRVAGWERQVAAELSSGPGRMQRPAGGGTRTGNGLVSRVPQRTADRR